MRLLLLFLFTTSLFAGPSNERYAELLKKGVCKTGVNYELLRNDPLVAQVDQEFQSLTKAEFHKLSESEQIAWYSNLYNFYTIKLILDKAPRKSIQDIGNAWDRAFVPLFGKKVSLNHIEHTILRKEYDEPRIHFALNCASIGCPALRTTPFTGDNLEKELDEQALLFLKDESKNRVEGSKLFVSQIFQWYGDDFKGKYGSFQKYVEQVLGLSGKYKIRYTTYDWDLNRATCN